jgi:uncharacterized protein
VVLQLMGLMLADARYAGLEALYGRDLVLGVFAQATQKTITSLESVQTQVQVIGGDMSEQQVIAFLDKLEQGSMRRPLEKITQAWADNDLQTLENYQDWCECADDPLSGQAFAKINDDRNPGMARRLTSCTAKAGGCLWPWARCTWQARRACPRCCKPWAIPSAGCFNGKLKPP